MAELSGLAAVVTGGGSGIGLAAARLLAARGAQVAWSELVGLLPAGAAAAAARQALRLEGLDASRVLEVRLLAG